MSQISTSKSATPSEQPPLRKRYFVFCKEYLAARPGGGFITDQASRLLLKHVKQYMTEILLPMRNLEANTRRVLDRFPHRRIDLNELEKYELVARSEEYAVSATCDKFKYRALLTEAIIDGEPKVLVDWKPTWKPVANIRKSALKEFRDMNRKKCTVQRRAQALLHSAHSKR